MDTSNSRQESGLGQVVGSTVDVVDYLFDLRKHKIVTTDFSVEVWVSIVRQLIELCQPYLKYFDGLKEIGYRIHHEWWQEIDTDHEASYPEGITNKTRVMSIHKSADVLSCRWEGDTFISHDLFLTSNGKILVLTKKKKRNFGSGGGSHRAKVLEFEIVDDERLTEILSSSYGQIPDLAKSLQEVLADGIKRREGQLASLESIFEIVTRFRHLIVVKVFCSTCGGSKERFGRCPICEQVVE